MRTFIAIALLGGCVISAPALSQASADTSKAPRFDPVTFTPPNMHSNATWIPIGKDDDGNALYFTFWVTNYQAEAIVKTIRLGLSNRPTTINTTDIKFYCGRDGSPPDNIGIAGLVEFSAQDGQFIRQWVSPEQGMRQDVPVARNSIAAPVVLHTCAAAAKHGGTTSILGSRRP